MGQFAKAAALYLKTAEKGPGVLDALSAGTTVGSGIYDISQAKARARAATPGSTLNPIRYFKRRNIQDQLRSQGVKNITGGLGEMAGSMAGAAAGEELGAVAGSPGGPVGAGAGAIAGGFTGGHYGGKAGRAVGNVAGKRISEAVFNND